MMKTTVITEIDELLDMYCEGCLVKKQLTQERGKTEAHKFCIRECTVGDQLRFLGSEMNKLMK
ncbi:zinc-finger domain-containing protein [Sporosarcina jeotgali]|uniref:Zinc-finger domain-containing protein n=2 Tax=Sporosarcina jeotgali TaxID=3020056 RepID=A0ABZ0KYK8_9BACL|nr:zinc-finger domain-containing protein [Sporosarcina sp. B2O-1]WOV85464.1 zinc-finger domain-containing protein [Sporosarcina sp. B2O-1]